MRDAPSYIGLLNAIVNAEAAAERYLTVWASITPRDDVRQVLTTVALREGEHAKAFEKRMCELGSTVHAEAPARAEEKLAIASSTALTDLEKFEKIGLVPPADSAAPDAYPEMFVDQTIDPQTGALLGRFVAEERDSRRMFHACYRQLAAERDGIAANDTSPVPVGAADGAADVDRLARIERLLEELVSRLPA